METLLRTTIAVICLFSLAACRRTTGGPDAPFSVEQLRDARRVTVKRINPPGWLTGKGQVTVTDPAVIGRLGDALDYRPTPSCGCMGRYKVTFALKDGRAAALNSWPHGWRFVGDAVGQRFDDGDLLGRLDALLGFRPPKRLTAALRKQQRCALTAVTLLETSGAGVVTGFCKRGAVAHEFACTCPPASCSCRLTGLPTPGGGEGRP